MHDSQDKTTVKQSIVDSKENDNTLHNATHPHNSPASSLDHEGMI